MIVRTLSKMCAPVKYIFGQREVFLGGVRGGDRGADWQKVFAIEVVKSSTHRGSTVERGCVEGVGVRGSYVMRNIKFFAPEWQSRTEGLP